jgi:hypothetical protein
LNESPPREDGVSKEMWKMPKKEDRKGITFPRADGSDYFALQFDLRPEKKYEKEIETQTKAV